MDYGTFTATPAQPPATETSPTSGISAGGVIMLAVAVAAALWLKRSGRRGQAPEADRKRTGNESAPAAETLPVVGMDQLRGSSPAWSLGKSPDRAEQSSPEKGRSLLSAPAAKARAHRLGIPYELAQRLEKGAWDAMCASRNLAGLERGEVEKTPYGVAVHVEFKGRMDFAAVQRGIDQIETGLDTVAGTIRLRKGASAGRGILDVRLRDPLADGVPWEQPAAPVRLAHPMWLSVTAFGDPVYLSLKQRIGVFGTSGSGKSCVQRQIGAHVAQAIDAEADLWDFKHGVEAQHYEGKAKRVTSIDAAVSRLDWLVDTEYPRRAEKMKERGVSEWVETPWDPALVIIVDEGNALVRGFGEWREEDEDGKPGAKGAPLKRLFTAVEQGRALGVYWVWATQFPKATSLPTEIRSQLNAIVCLKMVRDGEARVVFGDDDVAAGWSPQDLYGPGWLLVQDDSHTEPVDSKALWLSVDTFRALSGTAGQGSGTGLDTGQVRDRTPVSVRRTPGQSLSVDGTAPVPVPDAVPDKWAVSVSLDVWTVLLLSEEALSLSEIARRTERAKSSVSEALAKLTGEGDGRVIRDGNQYRLRVAEEK